MRQEMITEAGGNSIIQINYKCNYVLKHIIGAMTYIFRGSASSIERSSSCPLKDQLKYGAKITWANKIIVQAYPAGTPTDQISCLFEAQHHEIRVHYAYLHKAVGPPKNP